MAKKNGLGRGLDALFADAAPINEEEKISSKKAVNAEAETLEEDKILYVDINDIKPNSAQPRKHFDEDRLKELAESIKSNGVVQPLIVRKAENGYELVAGERRWRASRIAELKKVPCIIRNYSDKENALVAIIENMQRENLNPIEEAEGLKSMTEKYGFTQEQVSSSLGKSRTYITNSIRLLKLPEEIREYISLGQMSAAHGRTIINVGDERKQKEICEKVIKNGLSVRETERLADKIKDELKPNRKKRKTKVSSGKSSEILAVESELRKLTGTKVNVSGDGKKGKLEFEYFSTEELNQLIDMLREAFK